MNKEEIIYKLKDILGSEFEVHLLNVEKLNNTKNGIVIKKNSEQIGPIVYFENLPNDPDEALAYILVMYNQTRDKVEQLNFMYDYEWVKPRIQLRLFNKEWNRDILDTFVHITTEDELTVGAWVEYYSDDECTASFKITKELCNLWGVIESQIIEEGFKNFAKDKTKIYYSKFFFPGLSVFSNESGFNGAIRILDREAIRHASQTLDDDLYFLPSSIHEWMVIPAKEVYSVWVLQEIVKSANQEVVAPEERLGENVYFYNREEDSLKMVEEEDGK